MVDSLKRSYGQVVLVDNGGYFPETDSKQDVSWFLMDAMKMVQTDAVGVGDRDLKYGIGYLKYHVKRAGLPVTSANLIDTKTQKPVFPPYLVKKVGTVKVGFFSVLNPQVGKGPSRDSIQITEPTAVAKATIAELRKQGANVIVLLSQLGKVETEDLVTATEGIDAAFVGRNSPMLQKGRMIKNTATCYGGEKGQFMCRVELTLDKQRKATTGDAVAVTLGPEIPEKKEVLQVVKSFEDGLNEKLRRAEKDRAAAQAPKTEPVGDHFLGAELCMRCHQTEAEQWKTTSHSVAWQTLVDVKKDATPECVGCHVVGINKPGGFVTFTQTPKLVNVQCENCHGMGTLHDAFATTPAHVQESVCTTCHQGENDPEWNFAKKLPKIIHSNFSGETIKNKKNKMGKMGASSGSH